MEGEAKGTVVINCAKAAVMVRRRIKIRIVVANYLDARAKEEVESICTHPDLL